VTGGEGRTVTDYILLDTSDMELDYLDADNDADIGLF